MILTKALYRSSVWFFAVLLAASFMGFWPNYFSNPFLETDYYVHFHGITLTLWCILLVTQAYLIRANRRDLHRPLGKISYVLGPAVVISTLLATHNGLQGLGQPVDYSHALFGIILSGPLLFGLAYSLAIYHRKEPALHARFMVCTPLPFIGPIFNRVLVFYFPSYLGFLPLNGDQPWVQPISLIAMDAILAALAVWDWRSHGRLNVFPLMFGIFVAVHLIIFAVYDQPFWVSFVGWFLQLPLS